MLVQDSKLLLSTVHEVVSRSLSQWQTLNVEDIELALTLLYLLAEALPVCMFHHCRQFTFIRPSVMYYVVSYLTLLFRICHFIVLLTGLGLGSVKSDKEQGRNCVHFVTDASSEDGT